jgi:hypothetical protein
LLYLSPNPDEDDDMKAMSNVLVVVAMMLGATAAIGCNNASDQGSSALAPVETPAAAPVVDEGAKDDTASAASPGFEQNSVRFAINVGGPRYYAPHAPPAARFEHRGVAPSARHFWAPGYYRWSGREHVWVGGRWELHRPHHVYIAPRWIAAGPRYQYVPGHWVRRDY